MTHGIRRIAAVAVLFFQAGAAHAQGEPYTVSSFQQALSANPVGEAARSVAEKTRAWFGAEELKKGAMPKVSGLTAAWAIEAPEARALPRIVSEDGSFTLTLPRIPGSSIYSAAATLKEGTGIRWKYEVDGVRGRGGDLEVWTPHPDSAYKEGVPKGEVRQMPAFQSRIFEGTTRDWWVYVPAQYKPENPACVMVFQDGQGPRGYVPPVFDNLIHKGDMPVTVGVFISPGTFAGGRSNRSVEYDTLSDKYARFLLEEILPEVEKTVKLRRDAQSRAIAGISSGGICAFTVAWERPNEFHKVLSWVGSFTNIQHGADFKSGGHNYQAMIRKAPKRPIRVFLQDGSNDLDNANGNWPLANQEMDRSLKFAGYDYKFVYGQGFHSDRHGRAILPDSLRWLWRDYKP
jgi:enterochelin esterase family protein